MINLRRRVYVEYLNQRILIFNVCYKEGLKPDLIPKRSRFDFGDRVKLVSLGEHSLMGKAGTLIEFLGFEESRWRVLIDPPENRTVRVKEQNLEILKKAPEYIQVSGREGRNSKINGVYRIGSDLHEGRVFYYKPDDFMRKGKVSTIRWYPKAGEWLFDQNGLNFDNGCNAFAKSDVFFPNLVHAVWKVYNTTQFVPDPLIKLYVPTKEEIALLSLEESNQYPWAVGKI